jgi:Gpi18-like mannosyltransferase
LLASVGFSKDAETTTANLLKNGGFEDVSSTFQPKKWRFEYWEEGSFGAVTDKKVHSGKRSLLLQSETGNDIRMVQTIKVKPSNIYRFSGWVATENVPTNLTGANLSIMLENCWIMSPSVNGTNDWRPIELIFRTNATMHEITLAVRLGYYGSNATGKVYYDDFKLEDVNKEPVYFEQIEAPKPANQQPPPQKVDNNSDNANNQAKPGSAPQSLGYPILSILFYLLLMFGFMLRPGQLNGEFLGKTKRDLLIEKLPLIFAGFAGLTFLARLPLMSAIPFDVDMNDFKSWASDMLRGGPANFYKPGVFCDYPPFALYILWFIGSLGKLLEVLNNEHMFTFLIKLPSLICDIATAWLLFSIFRRKRPILGMILATIYMFLPPVIYNSSYWGQVDTYYTFLMMLSFYFLIVKRNPDVAAVVVVASLLTKTQTIAFLPLLLFYLFLNYDMKRCLSTLAIALGAFILIVLPFNFHNPLGIFQWVFQFYTSQAGTYPYATVNAANFMALISGNYVNDNTPVILGMSYNLIGILLFLGSVIWSCYYYWRKRTDGSLAAAFAMIAFGFFMFFPRMHERYSFPIMAFLLLAVGYYKDRKIFYSAMLLSVSFLINLHSVILFLNKKLEDSVFTRIMYILAIVNTAVYLAMLLIFQIQSGGKNRINKEFFGAYAQKLKKLLLGKFSEKPFKLVKRDYLTLGLIVLVYTIYIFTNLGSWNTPQTGVELISPEQTVVINLAGPSSIRTVAWYDAEGSGKMKLESFDGVKWNPAGELSCDNYYILRTLPVVMDGVTQLRVIPEPVAGHVNEISFFDGENKLVPVATVQEASNPEEPASGHALFDEPNRMSTKPNYLNSTYFDEIYHGRTAYEFIKGYPVYETTHPPFGKDLLGLGILLFGMNPFGLRFMHVITGILLMITLFFLGRMVLNSRFGAYATMALGMMDCMPFVQSRYSTIDTSSVLFIALMFLFTIKYVKDQELRPGPWKSVGTMVLIFVSAGLAAATKWTAVYGIAGVVCCFALVEFRKFMAYWRERAKLAVKLPKPVPVKGGRVKRLPKLTAFDLQTRKNMSKLAIDFWLKNFGTTLIIALVLFIIIVPVIYGLTYIPYLGTKNLDLFSTVGIREILKNQADMYDYHSKLNATHPFTSFWWSWPFNFKPLWIYGSDNPTPGMKSTIVSMGNPFIWFLGIVGLVILVYQLFVNRRITVYHFVFICFFSVYLPWVLVTRIAFIYHYYPCLPLLYLFVAMLFEPFWNLDKQGKQFVYVAGILCFMLLLLFYPAISGMEVPQTYISKFLYWFPKDWSF